MDFGRHAIWRVRVEQILVTVPTTREIYLLKKCPNVTQKQSFRFFPHLKSKSLQYCVFVKKYIPARNVG